MCIPFYFATECRGAVLSLTGRHTPSSGSILSSDVFQTENGLITCPFSLPVQARLEGSRLP